MITFLYRKSFGRARFYEYDKTSKALLDVAGRKCFELAALRELHDAGFLIKLKDANTGAEQSFAGWVGIGRAINNETKGA